MYKTEKVLEYVFCGSDVVIESQKITLKKISIGDLYLESGKIIANDPFVAFKLDPLNVVVPSGSYNVSIIIAEKEPAPLSKMPEPTGLKKFFKKKLIPVKTEPDKWIALSCLKFSDHKAVKWEAAKTGKENFAGDMEDDIFSGSRVESGMGGFMDKMVADKLLFSDADLYDENNILNGIDEDDLEPCYKLMDITNCGKNNFVMFSSEWRDRAFPSYFGFDETGKPCVLVTDFMVIEKQEV